MHAFLRLLLAVVVLALGSFLVARLETQQRARAAQLAAERPEARVYLAREWERIPRVP